MGTPKASPPMLVVLALLSAARDMIGPTVCRAALVGPMRRMLGKPPLPPGAKTIEAAGYKYELDPGMEEARHVLAIHCAHCRKCDLGLKDI
jgi:hypothetical protein